MAIKNKADKQTKPPVHHRNGFGALFLRNKLPPYYVSVPS